LNGCVTPLLKIIKIIIKYYDWKDHVKISKNTKFEKNQLNIGMLVQHQYLTLHYSSVSKKSIGMNKILSDCDYFSRLKSALYQDQQGVGHPDIHTPFKSKIDAFNKLRRYHVYHDPGPTPKDIEKSK
jgi:hypothetical protein